MKLRTLQRIMLGFALAGMLVPRTLLAAPQPQIASRGVDLALGPAGQLAGQVVDQNGQPLAQAPVGVLQHGQLVAVSITDDRGQFQVSDLRGGTYIVNSAGTSMLCRLWSHQTAPPAANGQLQIVGDAEVVRAQWTPWSFYDRVEQRPILWYGIFAAVIAVPIAVITHNDDNQNGS